MGAPETRVDGPEKVTGRARYAGDFVLPGMLHAVLLQSSVANGRLVGMETEQASRSRGVVRVFTRESLPVLQPPPAKFTESLPAERRAPLSDDEIAYAGQHIGLVVAETLEQAQAGAALVQARYEARTPVLELRAGMPGAYRPDHFVTNTEERLNSARGVPRAGAMQVVEPVYRTPVETHNPMEPSATVAVWEGGRLRVHDSTRWLKGEQSVLAAMLGVDESAVEIVSPFVGGAFGSKVFLWQHVAINAQAARVLGRPVKLALTRAQMFTSTGHRPRTVQRLRLGAGPDGSLGTTEHHTLCETSPVAHFAEPCGTTTTLLYATPHCVISHEVAPVNLATPCFMRAPGESPGMFALESAMDELASAMGMDPLALRLRNYAERDEAMGRPWSSKHLRECYRIGAERFGWGRRSAAPRSMRSVDGKLVGWGMATAAYPARRSPCTVRATMSREGMATFAASAQAIGTGTSTAMTQIAAVGMGLPMARVRFALGDSGLPEAPVAGASQTTASVGSAVAEAAVRLRECVLELANRDAGSPLQGVAVEAMRMEGGRVMGPGGREERLEALLARNAGAELTVTAASKLDEERKKAYTFHSFGAHFCEVEVDQEFGETRVKRWVAVLDAGRVLNRMGARSQVLGGVIFGIGMALLEQTVYDPRTGVPLNANLAEYLVPTCADAPEIDVQFVEQPDELFDPLGNRGLGELGMTGVPAAVANAVFHATGTRVRDLPLTPERVMGLD